MQSIMSWVVIHPVLTAVILANIVVFGVVIWRARHSNWYEEICDHFEGWDYIPDRDGDTWPDLYQMNPEQAKSFPVEYEHFQETRCRMHEAGLALCDEVRRKGGKWNKATYEAFLAKHLPDMQPLWHEFAAARDALSARVQSSLPTT